MSARCSGCGATDGSRGMNHAVSCPVAIMPNIKWCEPDYRREIRSQDGRFIVAPYADDDRWRYDLTDTVTKKIHDHMYPSVEMAQAHAVRILDEEMEH